MTCAHNCVDGWIDTHTGLMPCPRHMLTTHQEWANGHYRPTGPTTGPPPTPNPETTTTGLAAARKALTPERRNP